MSETLPAPQPMGTLRSHARPGSNSLSGLVVGTEPAAFAKATKAHEADGLERWEAVDQAPTLTGHGGGLPASILVPTDPSWIGYDDMNQATTGEVSPPLTVGRAKSGTGLIFSAEDSPAKTSASPEIEPDWTEHDQDFSSSLPASLTLFDLPGCSLKTYPGYSARTVVGTSASFLQRWPKSGTASPGGYSTHATSESPNDAVECSLSDILEATPDSRYTLSARGAAGVLRRSEVRGRNLDPRLKAALEASIPATT